MSASVVAHCCHVGCDHLTNLLQTFSIENFFVRNGFVEVGDIGTVMFVVVNFHREGIDVWFKGIERIP